jgi:hypothetical protein
MKEERMQIQELELVFKGIVVLAAVVGFAMVLNKLFNESIQQTTLPVKPGIDVHVPMTPEVSNDTPAQQEMVECRDFREYISEYDKASKERRLDAFEKKWKGEKVSWLGRVVSVSSTGVDFTMVPLTSKPGDSGCFVADCNEGDLRALQPGSTIIVRSKISSVSPLSTILTGK